MMRLLTLLFLCCSIAIFAQNSDMPIIQSYDYALPENNVSPIAIGMGGLNVTYAGDFYSSYSNPALIGDNDFSVLMGAFRIKSDEAVNFAEAAQFSNILKPKQLKYISLLAKQTAWTYQPVASVHIVEPPETGVGYRYYDYKLDKVQVTLAGSDDSWQPIRFGLNLKYLTGRLVYLVSTNPNSFIDDKLNGFSTDLGFTLQTGSFTYGLAAYDIFSRLYWEHYNSEAIQSRVAMGIQYGTDNFNLNLGLQGKIAQSTDTTYHLGGQYIWTWGSQYYSVESANKALALRAGLYSHNFYGTQNINYTIGGGYNYNIFRFDFSLNNKGMKLKDSELLISLGVGMP